MIRVSIAAMPIVPLIIALALIGPAQAGAVQTTPPPVAPAPEASAPRDVLERLQALRRDARDPSLSLDARRRAAESLLDGSRELASTHADDLRVGRWLADAAEDCFVTVLPLGGDLDSALFGLPSHEEWRRVSSLIAMMLDLTERAEGAAARAIARLSDPARPLDASGAALLDTYELIEVPRRLPLLHGLAEALAASLVETTSVRRRERGLAALARLMPLLEELEDEALLHSSLAAMLAAAHAGDAAGLDSALASAQHAAGNDAGARRRVEWFRALASDATGDHQAAVERIRSQSDALRTDRSFTDPTDAESAQRRAAMLESRLRRNAALEGAPLDGRHWTGPLGVWLAQVPPARRSAQRDAMLARLADLAESDIEAMHGAALADLAAAEALSRRENSELASLARLDASLAALDADDPWRAAALEASASALVRLGRHGEAVDRLIERADRFRTEPESSLAIEHAIRLARALDDGDPSSPARTLMRRAIDLAVTSFPDHPARGRWRVERLVLLAEALAVSDPVAPGDRDELAGALVSTRPALSALADTDEMRDLLARLAIATASVALASFDGNAALAALDAGPVPDQVPRHAIALRHRRVMALALVDRDLATDPVLVAAASGPSGSSGSSGTSRPSQSATSPAWQPAFESALLDALARLAPPLEPGEPTRADPRRRAAVLRLAALVDDGAPSRTESPSAPAGASNALRTANPALQLATAEALRAVAQPAAALPRFRALLELAPDRIDLLLAEAECLVALPVEASQERERLAQALTIYQRLLGDRAYSDDPAERTALWWLCQWRQLDCLQRAGSDTDRIPARIERLRVIDATLGGPLFAPRFEALLTRRGG